MHSTELMMAISEAVQQNQPTYTTAWVIQDPGIRLEGLRKTKNLTITSPCRVGCMQNII